MEAPRPTRQATPQNEGEGTGDINQTVGLVPKRTPLPTKRPVTVGNDTHEDRNSESNEVVTKSTSPTAKWLATVLNDNDETKDGEAKSVVAKKRTPLPTLLTRRPVPLRNNVNKVNKAEIAVAKTTPPAIKRPRRASKNDKGNENAPNTGPALKTANGVVLEDGRYCCNICGSQMKNMRHIISSHNSKLHPKDPSKGSAYLRQLAPNPTPCEECGKICSSLEMRRQHVTLVHKKAKQTTASTPSVNKS